MQYVFLIRCHADCKTPITTTIQEATCNVQVASSNKQVATEHIITIRKAATWAQLGVVSYLSIKQM